jgi:ElaB/YqjD/DUF883 family membrane-anchored ribosome-binding protein
MTNASSSNRPHSDTALLTGLQKKRDSNTNTTRAFLAQQAADAKTAIQHTVTDIQATTKEVADVRWWTQQYPWYAVGTAAVLGFVATTAVLVPSDHRTPSAPPATPRAAARPSWRASLYGIARDMLMGVILDALHAKGQPSGQTQVDASVS